MRRLNRYQAPPTPEEQKKNRKKLLLLILAAAVAGIVFTFSIFEYHGKPVTLTTGEYTVGADFEPGRYKIKALEPAAMKIYTADAQGILSIRAPEQKDCDVYQFQSGDRIAVSSGSFQLNANLMKDFGLDQLLKKFQLW